MGTTRAASVNLDDLVPVGAGKAPMEIRYADVERPRVGAGQIVDRVQSHLDQVPVIATRRREAEHLALLAEQLYRALDHAAGAAEMAQLLLECGVPFCQPGQLISEAVAVLAHLRRMESVVRALEEGTGAPTEAAS